MKTKYALLFLLLASFSVVSSELIESKTLFANASQELGQLSPDGKYFSYIRREERKTNIEFMDLDEYTVSPVLRLDESIRLLSYTWLNKDTIYFKTGSYSKIVEYILSFKKSDTTKGLFEISYSELNDGYLVDSLDDSPNHVMFARRLTYRGDVKLSLHRISIDNLRNGNFTSSSLVDEGKDELRQYFYDYASARIIAVFYEDSGDEPTIRLSYRHVDSKQWNLMLTYSDEDYQMSPVAFIDDENLAVLTNKETDKVALHSFNIKTQTLGAVLFAHETYDLTNAWLNESGELLAVEFYQAGLPQREWLAPTGNQVEARLKASFDTGVPIITSANAATQRMLIYVSGSDNPGEYFLYNAKQNNMTKLISKFPDLEGVSLATTKSFKIKVEDDLDIEAYLTEPVGIDHRVLLVMPHGGPIGVRDDSSFSREVQFLTNRGFSVLRVNFRGSSGYGKAFQETGVGQFGQLIEKDIMAAVTKVLDKQSYKNICAIGASYGAYSSVTLATKHPEIYDCIVASFGVYDLPLLFNYSNYRSGEEFAKKVAKVVGENDLEKMELSPVYNVDDINVPILLIAGEKDSVAGFEQSNRMRYLLEKKNKVVEYLFYKNTGHGHRYWDGDQHEYAYTVDFLYRHLSIPYPDAGTASVQSSKAIGYDLAKIATYFNSDEVIKEEKDKASNYFEMARGYNSGLANYKLAGFYLTGTDVEINQEKALNLYQQAAEQGSEDAAMMLSRIYSEGIYTAKNDTKALAYAKQAIEINNTFFGRVLVTRLYCIADKPLRDFDKCHQGFEDLKKESTQNYQQVYLNQNIAQSAIFGRYSDEEKLQMSSFIAEFYELNAAKFEVDVDSIGMFNFERGADYSSRRGYEEYEGFTIDSYKAKYPDREVLIGIEYQPDTEGFYGANDKTMSIIVWRTFDANNNTLTVSFTIQKGDPTNTWRSLFQIEDLDSGGYVTMSIYDGTGALRLERKFI